MYILSTFGEFLEILGFIVAFVAIIISIVIYMKQRGKKDLSYLVESSIPLVGVSEEIKERLKIIFDGKEVQQVHLVQICLTNSGNLPIRAAEFERPISMSFGKSAEIFTVDIIDRQPESLAVETRIEGNKISLEPALLNQGDSITFKMLVSKFEEVVFDGRIAGVKEIRKFVQKTSRLIIAIALCMIGQGLGYFVASNSESPLFSNLWRCFSVGSGLFGLAFVILYVRRSNGSVRKKKHGL